MFPFVTIDAAALHEQEQNKEQDEFDRMKAKVFHKCMRKKFIVYFLEIGKYHYFTTILRKNTYLISIIF